MKRSMSERYVKEILEKLEEIEKLHAKLRSLVPRVKDHEWRDVKNESKTNYLEQKPINFCRNSEIIRNMSKDLTTKIKKLYDPNTKPMKYLKMFKNHSNNKWKSFKNYLLTMNESDTVLVNRASQVSNDDLANNISEKTISFAIPQPKVNHLFKKRRSTLQDLPERLLKYFGYSHDSTFVNKNVVSIHDHGLGENEPHKVHKTSIIPDEKTETLKIVSSVRRISIGDNKK
ncbi:hypothetical protein E2986_04337 [Frieseomelitta varia]|uniref:Uncharacterized protein n=1 Tax=Frieseomelitta varia TaxID=561572 RepID=A0A833R6J7_9HYME|nr:uncharacterized protein LOC122535799 [Frieseomelitta varia]KAF3422134.1 hypothetical protein E2986_04337 [Frieseomelitta varia]